MVRRVVLDGCSYAQVAEGFAVSGRTVAKWVLRFKTAAARHAQRITVRRVLSDNGSGYLSRAFRATCLALRLRHLRKCRGGRPGRFQRFEFAWCGDLVAPLVVWRDRGCGQRVSYRPAHAGA